MIIREIIDLGDVDLLLSIAVTYPFAAEQSESIRKQLLREVGEAGGNRNIYVCFEDDVAVGMIELILVNADNDPTMANGKDIAHAHNMWVRSDRQGRGYARKMMAFLEDTARQMGKTTLTLVVDDINERAFRLYQQLGYETFRTEPGRSPEETAIFMKKFL
jgi:ribosomal protein S18 acetylase RimI-like enzyme